MVRLITVNPLDNRSKLHRSHNRGTCWLHKSRLATSFQILRERSPPLPEYDHIVRSRPSHLRPLGWLAIAMQGQCLKAQCRANGTSPFEVLRQVIQWEAPARSDALSNKSSETDDHKLAAWSKACHSYKSFFHRTPEAFCALSCFEASQRLAAPASRAQHETFVFRPQVVAKKAAVIFLRY